MKRWMAVAVLGLAAACGMVTPGTARASSPAWYQVYRSGFTGGFNQVAAISPSNIWAVGDRWTVPGKPVYTPLVRHFNGTSWQAITIPNSSGTTSDWVSASAGNNVWVGGIKNASTYISVLYRWNGAHWGKVPMPPALYLQGVVVLAPNNVWAYGVSGSALSDIFHWNGSKWQDYYFNFLPQGISASSASNVWVSGITWSGSKQLAAAYRWNGSAWHAVSMPHPVLYASDPNVTALSPANVWIGYSPNATDDNVLHWDGHQWHTMTLPGNAYSYSIIPDGKGGYWFGPQAILTGSTWTSEQIPFGGGFGYVVRIPGTMSFLMPTSVEAGTPTTQKPAIYRFDL